MYVTLTLLFLLQGTEIEQANDRELAEAQQQVRQLKQLVRLILLVVKLL